MAKSSWISKDEARKAIHDNEDFLWSVGGRISGRFVRLANLKIRKDSVVVDVIYVDVDSDRIERNNGVEYDRAFFEKRV